MASDVALVQMRSKAVLYYRLGEIAMWRDIIALSYRYAVGSTFCPFCPLCLDRIFPSKSCARHFVSYFAQGQVGINSTERGNGTTIASVTLLCEGGGMELLSMTAGMTAGTMVCLSSSTVSFGPQIGHRISNHGNPFCDL